MYTNKLVSNFKERVTELCRRAALPDGEIADRLGISRQTLSAWKCGTRSPKQPTIESIARGFGVSVEWLMGFDVPERSEKPTANDDGLDLILKQLLLQLPEKRLNKLLRLSPASLELLLEYADFLAERESNGSSAK